MALTFAGVRRELGARGITVMPYALPALQGVYYPLSREIRMGDGPDIIRLAILLHETGHTLQPVEYTPDSMTIWRREIGAWRYARRRLQADGQWTAEIRKFALDCLRGYHVMLRQRGN